jgi:hypothetical protein
MVTEMFANGGRNSADRPVKRYRRPGKPFDKRTRAGRRTKQLVELFTARLGDAASDPITATAIKRCAETTALSEDLRARVLRGEAIPPDDVNRASRTADLMTRRLLERAKPQPMGPTLSDLLHAEAKREESAL